MSEKGTWIKFEDGHPWLQHPLIGMVVCFKEGGTTWYNRDGQIWEGPNASDYLQDWLDLGFEECSEEEAKATLKKNKENKPATITIENALRAVDDEPEYTDKMPDEMWEAIKGDREAMTEALRITVRLTKKGIKDRIMLLTKADK